MNRNYLKYLFRTHQYLILFFLAVYLCICLVSTHGAEAGRGFYQVCAIAGVLSIGLTYVLPILLFSFVHHRSSADVYHALPISRASQRLTILLFVFAVCVGYFLITACAGWVLFGIGRVPLLRAVVIALFLAFAVVVLTVVNSTLYLFGNTVLDGIVIHGAYTFFAVVCYIAETLIIGRMVAGADSFLNGEISPFLSPVYLLAANYAALVSEGTWMNFSVPKLIAALIYGIVGWLGLKAEFDQRASERAGEISDHPLAYPTVINLYAIAILLLIASAFVAGEREGVLLGYLILLVCYIAGTFLYQRRIQIDWKRLALFGAEILITLGFMVLCWSTRGFGAAEKYTLTDGDILVYQYSAQADRQNLGEKREDYDEDCVYVNFHLEIPVRDFDRYSDAIEVMEQYRHRTIDRFYERGWDYSANLDVHNETIRTDRSSNRYSYHPDVLLSEAELRVLDRYTDVLVEDLVEYEYREIPLLEYFSGRGVKR